METTTPPKTTPRTKATPVATSSSEFFAELDLAIQEIDDQLVVSQGRCVDRLLDLYNLNADPVVRAAITIAIDDVRRVSAVRADELVGALRLIGSVAEIEGTFAAAA